MVTVSPYQRELHIGPCPWLTPMLCFWGETYWRLPPHLCLEREFRAQYPTCLTQMSPDSIAFFQTNAHIVSDVISHSFASLTFMTWDALLMFGDEVEHVWGTPWKSKVKWLYLCLRYVALIAHIAFSTAIFHLTSGHASVSTCRAWLIFQWVVVVLNVMSLESLLALCAYALCNQSRRVTLLYLALMGLQLASLAFNAERQIAETSYETACILVRLPKRNILSSTIVLATYTVFICLIVFKSYLAIRSGAGRTPLVSLLIKGGITIYGFLTAYFLIVFILIVQGDDRATTLFMWAVSISSTCGCRLIISLGRLARKLDIRSSTGPVITSQIEI